MAALASLLDDEGYYVSGSDINKQLLTDEKLKCRGIHVYHLDDKEYLKYDVIIIGHDFYSNELIDELKNNNKIFYEYHEFLDFYLNSTKLISICGSHGKTTVVNLLSLVEQDSSYLRGDGEGKKIEDDKFFFLESCEYKNHFLVYNPKEIIITNIDYDHVDFFKTKKEYINAFRQFVFKAKKVYINYSDRKKIIHKNIITFGSSKKADYYYRIFDKKNNKIYISIFNKKKLILDLEVNEYNNNFLNHITSVIAFLHQHNLSLSRVEKRLSKYKPASQRFEEFFINDNTIILDYAHHPKQIENNYQIISKKYKKHVKIAIFRGDRFSRVFYFKKQIKKALSKFDYAYVLPLPFMKENITKSCDFLCSKKIKFINNIEEIGQIFESNKKYSISLMSSKPFNNEIEYLKNIL